MKNKNFVSTLPSDPTLHLDTQLSIILYGGEGSKLNLTSSRKNVQASTIDIK